MIRVTIKLFAILRERAGVSDIGVDLSEPATVADASKALVAQHPELADLLPRVAYAVNRDYARTDSPLADGDEVAVLPPVSGG